VYLDLDHFKERYEIEMPVMSAHNLIIGRTYVDIGDTMTIRKVAYKDGVKLPDKEETCVVNFTRGTFFTKQEFKVDGEVQQYDQASFKNKVVYQIHGNWNNAVFMRAVENGKPVGAEEQVWKKNPYPE
jgi:hypothetical protein